MEFIEDKNTTGKTDALKIKKSTLVGLFSIVISMVAISSFFTGAYVTSMDSDNDSEFSVRNTLSSLMSQTEGNPVVAEINGNEIRLDEVTYLIDTEIMQGKQLDSITALDMVITKALLLEEAQKRDIAITLNDAEEQMTERYTQNGMSLEEIKNELEKIGTTYDKTLETFREELIINEMLSREISAIDIQITDQEAMLVFDNNMDVIKAQVGNSTVFADVSSQIKENLLQQKQQEAALEFIEEIENNALIIKYQDKLE